MHTRKANLFTSSLKYCRANGQRQKIEDDKLKRAVLKIEK